MSVLSAADALHAQRAHARHLADQRGAHYLIGSSGVHRHSLQWRIAVVGIQDGCRHRFELQTVPTDWGGSLTYLLGLPVEVGSQDVVAFEADRDDVLDDLVLASSEPGRVVRQLM